MAKARRGMDQIHEQIEELNSLADPQATSPATSELIDFEVKAPKPVTYSNATYSMKAEIKQAVKDLAQKTGTTQSAIVNQALEILLKHHGYNFE